jgi:hypothetical protein
VSDRTSCSLTRLMSMFFTWLITPMACRPQTALTGLETAIVLRETQLSAHSTSSLKTISRPLWPTARSVFSENNHPPIVFKCWFVLSEHRSAHSTSALKIITRPPWSDASLWFPKYSVGHHGQLLVCESDSCRAAEEKKEGYPEGQPEEGALRETAWRWEVVGY